MTKFISQGVGGLYKIDRFRSIAAPSFAIFEKTEGQLLMMLLRNLQMNQARHLLKVHLSEKSIINP